MGLDNYWFMPGESPKVEFEHPKFDPPLRLCGGMLSGHGSRSFRGKVYDDLILEVTGESLFSDELSNSTVREMSDKLQKVSYDSVKHFLQDEFSDSEEIMRRQQELEDLKRMFRVYAEAGASLHSWY